MNESVGGDTRLLFISDWALFNTDLQVVECVEFHEVVKLSEGLVGVLEVKSGIRRLGVVKDVKISRFLLFLGLSGNT